MFEQNEAFGHDFDMICETIKGNHESLVNKIINFSFLGNFHSFKHFDTSPIKIGYNYGHKLMKNLSML